MGALDDRVPASPQEAAAAIRALAYRASTAVDSGLHDSAVARAGSIADSILVGLVSDDVVDRASEIAGLIAAAEISDDDSYRDAAEILFASLSADFNPVHGVFESRSVYSSDQVAWIIGGLNSLAQKAATRSSSRKRKCCWPSMKARSRTVACSSRPRQGRTVRWRVNGRRTCRELSTITP